MRRNCPVEIGQRLAVTQRANLRHEGRHQVDRAKALGLEARERLAPVARALHRIGALDERAPGAVGLVGGRHPDERQVEMALIMRPLAILERGAALGVDKP